METLQDYLDTIDNAEQRERVQALVEWSLAQVPDASLEIKWNQPMITHQGTFILGFSVAAKHMSVAPEPQIMNEFRDQLTEADYNPSKSLFRIQWTQEIDYSLVEAILQRSFEYKQGSPTFWAK